MRKAVAICLHDVVAFFVRKLLYSFPQTLCRNNAMSSPRLAVHLLLLFSQRADCLTIAAIYFLPMASCCLALHPS